MLVHLLYGPIAVFALEGGVVFLGEFVVLYFIERVEFAGFLLGVLYGG